MILKFLEKIGRKKVVLDRGPSHPKFEEAKPWMNRYYVIFRNRPKWFQFNILIHEMLDDDHGPFRKPNGPGINIVIGFVPGCKSTL